MDCVVFYVEELHQGLMVEIACFFDFSLTKLEKSRVVAGLVLLENFKCDFVAILVLCFFNFSTEALSKGFANDVFVDCCLYHGL